MDDKLNMQDMELDDIMSELDDLFEKTMNNENTEKTVLTQNLEGFANCFPEWDLHPPV